jgi:HAMP domain-containing protein
MMSHSGQWVIPPLPVHPRPQPDEDLASLLIRTASGMAYDTPRWILRPEAPLPMITPAAHVLWLRRKADYHLLEKLLQLEPSQLYHLTLHRFATRLQGPVAGSSNSPDEIPQPLLSHAQKTRFFLLYQTTQVCPDCLAEDQPYGRVFWHCQFVTLCPMHRRFLIRRCPVCAAPIPLLRPQLSVCPGCRKGDYRQASGGPRIEHHSLLAGQTWLLQHLGVDSLSLPREGLDPLPDVLQSLLPWQYCDLLARFRFLLAPLLPAHPLLQGNPAWQQWLPQPGSSVYELSPYDSATLVATFHTLFVSWPARFVAILEALQHLNHAPEAAPGITEDFGAFYEHLVDRPEEPALAFVSEAFADYVGKQYTRGRVNRNLRLFRRVGVDRLQERPYITVSQASRLLEIHQSSIHPLLQQGLLTEISRSTRIDSRSTEVLIEKASVEQLRQSWEPLLTSVHVALLLLGIPHTTMAGLSRAGVLIPVRGPDVDRYPVSLYQPEAIEDLTRAVLNRAVAAPVELSETITVWQLYRFQTPWQSLADIVLAILKGRLIPIDLKIQAPLFQRLVVPKQRSTWPSSPNEQENLSRFHQESAVQALRA